jgi:hypothetical protein
VQIAHDRRGALESVKSWAAKRGASLVISPMGLWSGKDGAWIDAQRAKAYC